MKKSSARIHSVPPFIVAAVVLCFCLLACTATRKDVMIQSDPDAARFLAYLKVRSDNLGNFKGVGHLTIMGKGQGETMRVVWLGSQPGNLRVEILGIWGQPALTLLLKGVNFYVHNHQDNRHYKGKGTVHNLSRFISVPVRAEDLFSLLSGQPPLLDFYSAKVETSRDDYQRCLCLYKTRNRLIEKVWFKDDETTVERVELFDGRRNPRYTIEFSEFEQVDGLVMPHKIVVSRTKSLVWSLNIEKFWRKVPIPAGAYTLDFSGAKVVDLDS